ncbi:glycosyltransferase family 4 protein [Aestuariibacter halophilus]|uniref:Glycosyltransferase family 4 protein n=1 Tax=Fluctibacter halophilus TaxID=226011 RepID=A0ABS8GCW0_9ALTE|nr:glycosyltransferase family 4 protein [Aestuariibacter halophilus]MCC2618338.1 glycosyltransferase family 4 protein [Aestuariibacter halophilus]
MAKILLIIDSLGSGGAQRQLVTIARGLKARGHEVTFFTYFPQYDHFLGWLREVNIPVVSQPKKGSLGISVFWRLYRLIKQERFDGAMAFMQSPSLYLEMAVALIPRRQRPRVVFSDRTTFAEDFRPSFGFILRQQLHRYCDVITANSHAHCDKLQSMFPWMKQKLLPVYNGIEPSVAQGQGQAPIDKPYLLSVSRVIGYKNFQRFADAMLRCFETFGDVPTVIWVGRVFPIPEVEKAVAEIQQRFEQRGIADRLQFVGEQSDVARYYQHASALVHPSRLEGFSNAVVEGMMAGLPLLLGNISDHQRIVQTYQNGWIFDVDNTDSMVDALRHFQTCDAQTLQHMASNSHEAAVALFSFDKATEQYEALLTGQSGELCSER